ncbi:hypothetical protein MTY66_53330 [Mycolicibacterium sp. TY66]|nr:hypothetical protein MTY66_53330 [Mycolicibacterium sp. TY66]BCJ78652.1 hypothetical protein MTY81_00250 [Mycolicibacterium sp. TY81]
MGARPDITALPTEGGLCTFKPVVGGAECPKGLRCNECEDFVLTGADYAYWKRQEERWATYAENAPNESSRAYVYQLFQDSSMAMIASRGVVDFGSGVVHAL